jgi:hypothetical protein
VEAAPEFHTATHTSQLARMARMKACSTQHERRGRGVS